MLDNIITLPVDPANNGTVVEEEYRRYTESENRAVYIGENHSIALRNTMTAFRTQPKPNGNFRGTGKSAVKFTQDFAVPGVDGTTTIVAPAIVDISFSLPVGITPADAKLLRQRLIAIVDYDAIISRLTELLEV